VPDHELLRCIGRGNYGEVWLARSVTGQWRAVKIVWRRNFSSDRPYDREFQGIVRFEPISRSHAGVVPVLHVGRDEGGQFFYYVMELADADRPGERELDSHSPPNPQYAPRTLRSDLKRLGRLPCREVLHLGVQLAGALGHLHQHDLVHRDVKPSNVIYIDARPRLADIGLVAGIDEARSFVGTEGFIAPEGPGTPQADLFALGKLLYEAATGRDRCDFPSLPEDLNQWPDHEAVLELNEVLARTCSPNPKLRHTNAAELAGDLNLLLAGRSIRHVYSVERRLRRFSHAALATTALAVLALGAFWFQRARSAQAEERARHELVLRQRAERAEQEKGVALRQALLEQARALVHSQAPDRRSAALAVLHQAALTSPGADLRTVAAAALATPELREVHSWPISQTDSFLHDLNETYMCGNAPGLLEFRRLSDNALLRTLSNGLSRVGNTLFSPDDRWLVTEDKERSMRLWDLAAGTNRVIAQSTSWSLEFSSDSRFLYRFRGRGNLVRETLMTGERTEFPSRVPSVYAMALHPQLPFVLVSHSSVAGLSVISLDNGEVMEKLPHPDMVMGLTWNPAGNQLAAGCQNGSIWIWDWPLKSVPRQILRHHKRDVTHLSMHPGSRWLVSSSWDGQSGLWDLENGQLAAALPGRAWDFSRDGSRLRLSRTGRGMVMEFDEAFQPKQLPAHRRGVAPLHLAFSPDGQWLVTGGEDGAWLWDAVNWKPTVKLTDEMPGGVGIAGNCSQVFVAGAKRWQAWKLPVATSAFPAESSEASGSGNNNHGGLVPAFSPPERVELPWAKVETLLWAGVVDPRSGRWVSFEEARRGKGTLLRTAIAGSETVKEIFFETKSGGNASISPDGRWTARGNWLDNDVWVIDLAGGAPPQRIAQRGNTATVFSPDSTEVVVCGESVFRFITLGTWRERLAIPREVRDAKPGRAAYAHKDSLVALLTSRSHIRLLRPEDGREYLTLSTHGDRHIDALLFSPDDRYLVATSPDHRLFVWDLETLRARLAGLGLDDQPLVP
jgi:serine/threonine protein kinase